jgi:hypothetical protein
MEEKNQLNEILDIIDNLNDKYNLKIFVTKIDDLLKDELYEGIFKNIMKDRYGEIAEIM